MLPGHRPQMSYEHRVARGLSGACLVLLSQFLAACFLLLQISHRLGLVYLLLLLIEWKLSDGWAW